MLLPTADLTPPQRHFSLPTFPNFKKTKHTTAEQRQNQISAQRLGYKTTDNGHATSRTPHTMDDSPPRSVSPVSDTITAWFWIELFCGYASFTRYAMSQQPGWSGACIIVDFRPPDELGITDLITLPNVFYICMDLFHLTYADIETWCLSLLGRALTELYAIHASHPCDTLSLASACMGELHRGPNSAPVSWMAQRHDAMLYNLINIMETIHGVNSHILLTIENPWHSHLRSLTMVQQAIARASWHLLRSDHCASASPILDGLVTGPPLHRTGGLWPMKSTAWLVIGLHPLAVLPTCSTRNPCNMLVPDTNHHVLVICSRTEGLRRGQRRLPNAMRGRIPLGIFETLTNMHDEFIQAMDGHEYLCYVCVDGGDLLLCTNCTRVFHPPCNQFSTSTNLCVTCALRARA